MKLSSGNGLISAELLATNPSPSSPPNLLHHTYHACTTLQLQLHFHPIFPSPPYPALFLHPGTRSPRISIELICLSDAYMLTKQKTVIPPLPNFPFSPSSFDRLRDFGLHGWHSTADLDPLVLHGVLMYVMNVCVCVCVERARCVKCGRALYIHMFVCGFCWGEVRMRKGSMMTGVMYWVGGWVGLRVRVEVRVRSTETAILEEMQCFYIHFWVTWGIMSDCVT